MLEGVVRTRVGYCGGKLDRPTYHNLGDHTESIQLDYDPAKISYEKLLDLFWARHNPCAQSWSRQYASLVFVHDEEQKKAVEASRARVEKERGAAVKTEVLPYVKFWPAEDYHQKYELRGVDELEAELSARYPRGADFMNSPAAARLNGYIAGQGTKAQLEKEIARFGLSPRGQETLRKYVVK